jgi:alkanesulfonate monooxygenase SsuD/methylene tetrahydromethanopterin reductase-like flavin-dependent oxidoreductase (luciferase family)
MDTGIAIFPTHDAIPPADLARLAEERGHESLFFPEHTHIPASRTTPHPSGRELPRRYAHTFDLFVAVTAAVTVTTRLRVGSGICLVIERDPITTAKEVASVDYLSGRSTGCPRPRAGRSSGRWTGMRPRSPSSTGNKERSA